MGTKDITEKYLAGYNDVFADIVNVLLFKGEKVISPDSLATEESRSVYKADGQLHEVERDISKLWKEENVTISLFGLENQTNVAWHMPLRIIGYDGAAYRAQYDQKGKKYPVISLVLYFGTERKWDGPVNLKKCLRIPNKVKSYVNDYKMHVFNIAFLSDNKVKLFQSDFRIVADYFVQIRKNHDYVPSKETIEHVDAVLKLMSVLTNDARFEEAQNEKGEIKNMCEVLDRAEARGEARGEIRGEIRGKAQGEAIKLTEQIKKKFLKGKLLPKIAEELEEKEENLRELYNLVVENPEKTPEEIVKLKKL